MGGKSNNMGRRLSKPQSKNPSTSNLLDIVNRYQDSSSPMTASDVDYFGDTVTVSSGGNRRSKSKSRSKLREYLYGTPNDASQSLSSDEEMESPSSSIPTTARRSRKSISKTGSVFTQMSSAKTSTVHLPNNSTPKLLLTANDNEPALVAAEIKERAHLDSLAAQNQASSPGEEEVHPDYFFPPVRRKSLYTPGLATRNASDILRKPPPPASPRTRLSEEERNYYYNPSHSESSPLSRLAALSLAEDGRSTPSNLSVTHLGGIKLGTLRVTNGTTSPTSQPKTAGTCYSPTLSFHAQEEYHTATEGSGDEAKQTPTSQSQRQAFTEEDQSYCKNDEDHGQRQRPKPATPAGKDPLALHAAASMACQYIAELSGSPFAEPDANDKHSLAQEVAKDEGVVMPDLQPLSAEVSQADRLRTGRGTTEDALGRLEGNPASKEWTQRPSGSGSVTSKSTCESDPASKYDSGYASNGSTEISEDSRQHHTYNRPGLHHAHTADNTDYRKAPVHPRLHLNDVSRAIENDGQDKRSSRVFAPSKPITISSSKGAKGRKLQKPKPVSQPGLQTLINTGFFQVSEDNIPRVPSAMAVRHAERLTRFPLLEHTFPSSSHLTAEDTRASHDSDRMPLRFPSPANTIEAAKSFWPLGPRNVRPEEIKTSVYSSVASEDPTGCYEEFPGKPNSIRSPSWSAFGRRSQSKDRRKLLRRTEEVTRQQEKQETELAKQLEKEKKEVEKKSKRQEREDKSLRSRASSRIRGKSAERRTSQCESAPTLCDLGTVAASLGGSPYDIATNLHPSTSRASSGHHPYQMSSAMQRPQSFVGMDDVTASELNRARSRARRQSSGCPDPPVQTYQNRRDSSVERPRPRSMFVESTTMIDSKFHDRGHLKESEPRTATLVYPVTGQIGGPATPAHFNDRGGIPGKMPRPHSSVLEAPPVPALPSPRQIKQQEVVARERPHSLAFHSSPSLSTQNQSEHGRSQMSSQNVNVGWETQRRIWSERRKSAGEALLHQHRHLGFVDTEDTREGIVNPDGKLPTQAENRSHVGHRDVCPAPQRSSMIPPVTGRYEGGLHFGFEPGCGLGGSAGTRGVENKASRKSSHFSKGYGLDLSDVPVFVAATPR